MATNILMFGPSSRPSSWGDPDPNDLYVQGSPNVPSTETDRITNRVVVRTRSGRNYMLSNHEAENLYNDYVRVVERNNYHGNFEDFVEDRKEGFRGDSPPTDEVTRIISRLQQGYDHAVATMKALSEKIEDLTEAVSELETRCNEQESIIKSLTQAYETE